MRFTNSIVRTAALLVLVQATVTAADCDRVCLISLADNYLAALTAHDPHKVPKKDN
jgi:hypothetical protein